MQSSSRAHGNPHEIAEIESPFSLWPPPPNATTYWSIRRDDGLYVRIIFDWCNGPHELQWLKFRWSSCTVRRFDHQNERHQCEFHDSIHQRWWGSRHLVHWCKHSSLCNSQSPEGRSRSPERKNYRSGLASTIQHWWRYQPNLDIEQTTLTSFTAPRLLSIGGYLQVVGNPLLKDISLPALARINGPLDVQLNPALATIVLPRLESINQDSTASPYYRLTSGCTVEGNFSR